VKYAEHVLEQGEFTFEHFTYERLEDFVGYFVEIYNTIWSSFHENYSPLQKSEIRKMLLDSKPILDEELMWFAFDNGKPIGFIGVTPDVNQVLAKLKNGRLTLINKLKFLYYKKRAVKRARVFVAGAHPDYQNKWIVAVCYGKTCAGFCGRGASRLSEQMDSCCVLP